MKLAGFTVHQIITDGEVIKVKGGVNEPRNPLIDDLPIEQICNPMKFRNEQKAKNKVEKSI